MLVNTQRMQVMMEENDFDGLIFSTAENVYYMTGIRSVSLQLFPHDGKCFAIITRDQPSQPCFISSMGEVDQVLDGFSGLQNVITFGNFYRDLPKKIVLNQNEKKLNDILKKNKSGTTPEQALFSAIKGLGLSNAKIGIDEAGMNPIFIKALKDTMPRVTFSPASELIGWVRRVKTIDELNLIELSTNFTEKAIQKVLAIVKEGVTEKEIALQFNISLVEQGVTPKACLIKFGRNGVGGQVVADETKLLNRDTIWFDVMTEYQGYWADVARTFSYGKPKKRIQYMYNALLQGEQEILERAAPNMTGKDVFQIGMTAVQKAGLPNYKRHHLGHGIGLELYEKPILSPDSLVCLEENMVLNIETPYYEFGLGALHVEDPIQIGNKSNKLLTKSSRALHVIE